MWKGNVKMKLCSFYKHIFQTFQRWFAKTTGYGLQKRVVRQRNLLQFKQFGDLIGNVSHCCIAQRQTSQGFQSV